MPELTENMYCSQQICIPPTFPYLLRQFAKSAIRTQPSDLLRWSCAYFRCLSLNIPPPVKPRLEYPIPKDYHGITPGWIKALYYQLQTQPTVSFKILWDRWIGACLEHHNLIQILCLGGFTDNTAIPFLRFLALCAGFLAENLTQTMIMICEILTEEPEGGSAMIPATIFIDLYQFLARIDASVPQTLRNYYFLDKFLGLYEEEEKKEEGPKELHGETPQDEFSLLSSSSTLLTEEASRKEEDLTSMVSCPSVPSQEHDNFVKLFMKIQATDGEYEGDEEEKPVELAKDIEEVTQEEKLLETVEEKEATMQLKSPKEEETVEEKKCEAKYNEKCLEEDLQRLRELHHEMMGPESDDEMEKFKARLLAEVPLTESQTLAPGHFETKIEDFGDSDGIGKDPSQASVTSEDEKPKVDYEEVFVEAIPGIGRVVPERLVAAVCGYMRDIADIQHLVVMPRNVRHYECPPLEENDD